MVYTEYVYVLVVRVRHGDSSLPVIYNAYLREEDAEADGKYFMEKGKFSSVDMVDYHVAELAIHDKSLHG